MLEKPDIGAACNGCGLCCKMQICSTGSFVMGLVENLGERVPGPCPALREENKIYICGLVQRPKAFLDSPRGVTVLREALKIMIGAGAGCDEAGDEPDESAAPKLASLQKRYLDRHGEKAIKKAVATILEGIKNG